MGESHRGRPVNKELRVMAKHLVGDWWGKKVIIRNKECMGDTDLEWYGKYVECRGEGQPENRDTKYDVIMTSLLLVRPQTDSTQRLPIKNQGMYLM